MSRAALLPTCLLLILGSRPVSLWLAGGSLAEMSSQPEGGALADQLFFFSVIAGSIYVGFSRRLAWGRLFSSNLPLMLWYLFFAMSVAWSWDPMGSAKRLVKDFGMLCVVAVLYSEKDPIESIRAVYFRCACVLFPLSVVLIKYFPSLSREFTMEGEPLCSGVTTQKNTLGEIILVFGLFLCWDFSEQMGRSEGRSRRKLPIDHIVLIAMAAWLLYMSQSKTALLCLVVGGFIIFSRNLVTKFVARMILAGTLVLPYVELSLQKFSAFLAPIFEALGRNMTLTGRTDIWNHIRSDTVNPLVGCGFWNFWGGEKGHEIARQMQTIVPNAHCGYLDIYLDGGIVGLVLLFLILGSSGARIISGLKKNRFQRVRFAMLIVVIIYNLSESTFARLGVIWFTTLLVLVELTPKAVREVRQAAAVSWGARRRVVLQSTELRRHTSGC